MSGSNSLLAKQLFCTYDTKATYPNVTDLIFSYWIPIVLHKAFFFTCLNNYKTAKIIMQESSLYAALPR